MPPLIPGPIFISYSRRDDEVMRKIAFFLRDQGFKVWVDNEKLISGTAAWEESIENAIKNAFIVIVVLSPDSKSSEWVRREITYADQFNKRVFPVLVKGSEEDSLPLRLITRQYIDMREDENKGLSALHEALTFYIEKKQTLEMQRPADKQGASNASPSTPIPVAKSQNKQSSRKWILPAGIFLIVCILGLGALWIGYRILSPLLAANQPVETAVLSETPAPTEDIPSDTQSPSLTPDISTLSISDKPSEYLNDIQILNTDSFDNLSTDDWSVTTGTVKDGVLEIVGDGNWDGVSRNKTFGEGEGLIVDFSYSTNSLFETFMDYGEYGADSHRRFGIYAGGDRVELNQYKGSTDLGGAYLSGDLTLEPDTTYSLLMAILPDGELLEVIWNPSDPSKTLYNREKFDSTWAGLTWTFYVQANTGTIHVDNFREISFSGAK